MVSPVERYHPDTQAIILGNMRDNIKDLEEDICKRVGHLVIALILGACLYATKHHVSGWIFFAGGMASVTRLADLTRDWKQAKEREVRWLEKFSS